MVKRGSSSFSASSVAKGSIVLSKAIKKQFALEAEISRLHHHVSVLSKRLHSVTLEKQILGDIVESTKLEEKEPLNEEEVADEEAAPSVAGEELGDATESVAGEEQREEATPSVADEDATMCVADEEEKEDEAIPSVAREEPATGVAEEIRMIVAEPTSGEVPEMAEKYNRFVMDLVEDVDPIPPQPSTSSRVAELEAMCKRVREGNREKLREYEELVRSTGCACLEASESSEEIVENGGNTVGEMRRLGSSGDEDAVIGGVIVAGGASTERKNAARRKKRKLLREERKEERGW